MADESTTPETEGTESTEDKGTEVTDAATAEDKDGDESGLGDAGKKALSEERAAVSYTHLRAHETLTSYLRKSHTSQPQTLRRVGAMLGVPGARLLSLSLPLLSTACGVSTRLSKE